MAVLKRQMNNGGTGEIRNREPGYPAYGAPCSLKGSNARLYKFCRYLPRK